MTWQMEMIKSLEVMQEALAAAISDNRMQGSADASIQQAWTNALRLRSAVNRLTIREAMKQFTEIEKVYYALFEDRSLVRMAWAVDRLAEDKSA